jgi:hypothetical protein
VSPSAWLSVMALAGAAALALALVGARARLRRLEERIRRLEDVVHHDVEPALAAARRELGAAAATARDAAVAAGVDSARPRLVFEPVAGPVVRAVAFGASARRAVLRMASPRALGRERRPA